MQHVTRIFLSIVLIAAVLGVISTRISRADAGTFELLSSAESGLEFVVRLPEAALDETGLVQIDGADERLHLPGAPQLPWVSTLIALPPGANAAVAVDMQQMITVNTGYLAPASQVDPAVSLDLEQIDTLSLASAESLGIVTIEDSTIYDEVGLYPAEAFELSAPIEAAGVRYVQLKLYPARYNAQAQQLEQSQQINVSVTFTDVDSARVAAAPTEDVRALALLEKAVNGDAAHTWVTTAEARTVSATSPLPIGVEAFKIEVDRDGIYTVDYTQLATAGMDVNSVDPNTFEMMYRGEPVAFELISDGDTAFEPGEMVRFYGWAFDGPRLDAQYVINNVFWLWANGTPNHVQYDSNPTGYNAVTTYRATEHMEPNLIWTATYSYDWDRFPNDPDAWYWYYLSKRGSPLSVTLPVTLTAPSRTGNAADFTAEFTARFSTQHSLSINVNGTQQVNNHRWFGVGNDNAVGTIPDTDLINGQNQFEIIVNSSGDDDLFLNRITVEYDRRFEAVNDYLAFNNLGGGNREYTIDGFNNGSPGATIVLDVSDRLQPRRILLGNADVAATANGFSYRVAKAQSGDSTYVVTNTDTQLAPVNISSYTATQLHPSNGADWLAISYGDFVATTQRLADHRVSYSNMTTHIADIEDVINQYGFGLPLPSAMSDYIADGVTTWSTPLRYVTLIGDTTLNVQQRDCTGNGFCFGYWRSDETIYIPTNLMFVDRFLGLIPSDHQFSSVVGDDLSPDVAVGRLAVSNTTELNAAIDKIIRYENNLLTPQPYMEDFLFLADNIDAGGNFCYESQQTASLLPSMFDVEYFCLNNNPSVADETALHNAVIDRINSSHALLLNYRGHGSITDWAGGNLMNRDQVGEWTNANNPFVILSADCLDGNFAWVNREALSETFLHSANGGSAAHWSSTGLGYSFEHTVMHQGFYEALFTHNLTAIGDAINYAKQVYLASGEDLSELYAFTLQGDPAMQLLRSDASVEVTTDKGSADFNEEVKFTITISNSNIYPTGIAALFNLPDEVQINSITGDRAFSTVDYSATSKGFLIDGWFGWGDTATITVTAMMPSWDYAETIVGEITIFNSRGVDIGGNNSGQASVALTSDATAVTLSQQSAEQNVIQYQVVLFVALASLTVGTLLLRIRPRRKMS